MSDLAAQPRALAGGRRTDAQRRKSRSWGRRLRSPLPVCMGIPCKMACRVADPPTSRRRQVRRGVSCDTSSRRRRCAEVEMRTNYRGLPAIIAPTIHRDVLHTSYAAFIHTRHLLLLWLLAVAVASSVSCQIPSTLDEPPPDLFRSPAVQPYSPPASSDGSSESTVRPDRLPKTR